MSIQRARDLRLAGQYSDAVALLATMPNPNDIGVLRERLLNHFQLRQIDELIETTRLIQGVDATYEVEALAHCGLLLRGLGNRSASVEYFRATLIAHGKGFGRIPDWVYSEFAGVLIDQRDWRQALDVAMAGAAVIPALNLSVAHIHIRLGDFGAARDSLRLVMNSPPGHRGNQSLLLSLITEMWIHDGDDESQQWIIDSKIMVLGETAPHLANAELAVTSRNHKFAATLWLQVACEHKSLRQFVMRRIAEVVRAERSLLTDFCLVFEGLITLDPTEPHAVFAYYEYLTGFMTHEDAIAIMLSWQGRASRIMPALAVELIRWGCEEDLRDLASHQVESWVRSSRYVQCSRFLDAICRFQPLDNKLRESIGTMPHCTLQLFFMFRLPQLKTVNLWETAGADANLLRDAGIDAQRVREFVEGITRLSSKYDAYLDNAQVSCAAARQKIRDEECFVAFQDHIVRDRNFRMIDPFSERMAALLDSVKIFDRQIFAFVGSELILAISGGNMNAIVFIYLPHINILIPIDRPNLKCSQNYYGSQIHMADLVAVYLSRIARRYEEFLAAALLAPQREGVPRKIVAIHGRAENPAHHSWNYLSSFERLNIEGLLGNIHSIVRPPTEYFGNVKRMFHELGNAEALEFPEHPAIDPRPFSVDHVVIQLGGSFITRGLKNRLQTWALGEIAPQRRVGIENSLRAGGVVIWLGLRVGDKVWVRQETGLAAIIDEVCKKYPGCLFLLDGFSVPTLGDTVPVKWSSAFEELRGITRRIKTAASDPSTIIDMLGGTLAESLVYAMHATLYFTPMGSSQHKVGWYSDCPGIVYTSTKFAAWAQELLPGAWESEGSAVPDYLFGTISAAGKKRGHFDFRSNLENIDIPESEVTNRILNLLARRMPKH